ncbi:glutamate 5-kinase, partial [Brevundimonas sp. GN22]
MSATSPQAALDQARRIVLKIGSSLVFDPRRKEANRAWMAALAEDIADLRAEGREVIIVSSGAVALGRARIQTDPKKLADKQAAAAVGQSLLMKAWEEALAPHDLLAGQILLTRDDTERRRRWLNARATAQALLHHGIIPVVNENDTVTTEEIRYGDNDRLAARTAQLAQGDLLIL